MEQEDRQLPSAMKKDQRCIICSGKAVFCVRGMPQDSYCSDCAADFFQTEYLDRL